MCLRFLSQDCLYLPPQISGSFKSPPKTSFSVQSILINGLRLLVKVEVDANRSIVEIDASSRAPRDYLLAATKR